MYGNILNSSSNSIPTSFDETAGSKLLSAAPSSGELVVLNYTSDILALFVGAVASAPSSSLPGKQAFIPAAPSGGCGFTVLNIKVIKGDRVYLRATTSSVSSGKVYWYLV